VPARLATVILQLVEQDGVVTGDEGCRILTRYTHEELATMVGAKRVAVSRAMKDLREAGAVGHAGRHIVVEDAKALRRIARDAA
jgi:CRP-like cAMP-binding protein